MFLSIDIHALRWFSRSPSVRSRRNVWTGTTGPLMEGTLLTVFVTIFFFFFLFLMISHLRSTSSHFYGFSNYSYLLLYCELRFLFVSFWLLCCDHRPFIRIGFLQKGAEIKKNVTVSRPQWNHQRSATCSFPALKLKQILYNISTEICVTACGSDRGAFLETNNHFSQTDGLTH